MSYSTLNSNDLALEFLKLKDTYYRIHSAEKKKHLNTLMQKYPDYTGVFHKKIGYMQLPTSKPIKMYYIGITTEEAKGLIEWNEKVGKIYDDLTKIDYKLFLLAQEGKIPEFPKSIIQVVNLLENEDIEEIKLLKYYLTRSLLL